jgi:hypothetical protein
MAVSWLKQGEDSAKLHEQEKAAQIKRQSEQGKSFRFWLKKGDEASIWFVDGALHTKGYLAPPRYYEHTVFFNNTWDNIVCPQQTMPSAKEVCPICEGKDRAALVSLFTVIDTRPYTTKNGITIPFTRKLFVAKPTTFDMLNKMAIKRGGLTGCRFDVSRTGDKSPNVGDVFDFQEKSTDVEALTQMFTSTFKVKDKQSGSDIQKTVNLWEPLPYEKEIIFRTGDELRKMGFGAPTGGSGFSQDTSPAADAGKGEDYETHL